MKQAAKYTLRCIVCNKEFQAMRKDARTCSNKCRTRLKVWRAHNAKAAKAAILALCILRQAAVKGTDDQAIGWIARIESALNDELTVLKQKGIAIPTLLDLERQLTEDCKPNVRKVSRLRQAGQNPEPPQPAQMRGGNGDNPALPPMSSLATLPNF